MDIFETPMEVVLNFREANREISRGKDRVKELANRFATTSNNFCPSAFDRALVPQRARKLGSPLDQGRVVSKNSRSFSLASSGVIRAWSWLYPGCRTQNQPCLNFSLRFRSISSHFPSSPGSIRSGLVNTAMMYFISAVLLGLLRLTDSSLAHRVECTNQMTAPLVFRIGYENSSALINKLERIARTFAAYCKKDQAMGILNKPAH